jgi:hypothetical protein
MGTSKNHVFNACHPEPKAKDPDETTGFFAPLRMTPSYRQVFRGTLISILEN